MVRSNAKAAATLEITAIYRPDPERMEKALLRLLRPALEGERCEMCGGLLRSDEGRICRWCQGRVKAMAATAPQVGE